MHYKCVLGTLFSYIYLVRVLISSHKSPVWFIAYLSLAYKLSSWAGFIWWATTLECKAGYLTVPIISSRTFCTRTRRLFLNYIALFTILFLCFYTFATSTRWKFIFTSGSFKIEVENGGAWGGRHAAGEEANDGRPPLSVGRKLSENCLSSYMPTKCHGCSIDMTEPSEITHFWSTCLSLGTKALFRCKKFLDFDTVAFSFLFDKHCLIME